MFKLNEILLFQDRAFTISFLPDLIIFYLQLDHLLTTNLKTIISQATDFEIVRSISLALSMKNIIVAPPVIVKQIIALSIKFVADESSVHCEF